MHPLLSTDEPLARMLKDVIRKALEQLASDLSRPDPVTGALGPGGVAVPRRSTTQPCSWKKDKRGTVWIPWEIMIDVAKFTLDNAFVKMDEGVYLQQVGGIPMGDAISPGMTIAACDWMEKKWLESTSNEAKERTRARRYCVIGKTASGTTVRSWQISSEASATIHH